jgi:RNA polymerase primary sigma factor
MENYSEQSGNRTALQTYYGTIVKYNPLPKKRELELLKIAKTDPNAKDLIILSNLKFVLSVANKYKDYGYPMEDLISEGNYGLILAIDKFDEKKNVRFITFAMYWIRFAIQRYISKERIESRRETEYRHIPSYKELNGEADAEDEYERYGDIDEGEDDDSDMENTDEEDDNIFSKISAIQKKILLSLIGKLSEKERSVLLSYFGVGENGKENLLDIGSKLGISKERARQLKDQALSKLRIEVMKNKHFSSFFEPKY